MKFASKIGFVLLLVFSSVKLVAQNESLLQPFWNPVVLNPGFAGLDNTTSFRTGNQYYHLNDTAALNLFYATYDTWSDKLRGGIAVYFQQGIIGKRNISTTEMGFGYSGYPKKTRNGKIRFTASTHFALATKQWWVFSLDGLMIDPESQPNPPGNGFIQYLIVKPKLGFLWEAGSVTWGLTAGVPLQIVMSEDSVRESSSPFNVSLYFAKKSEGYKKGLHSLPYRLNPELMVFYQEDLFLSRFRVFVEYTNSTVGMFIQSDFTNNIHSLGGTFGIASEFTRLDLSLGVGIPGLSDQVGFCAEVGLHLTIPKIDYGKRNPWATD